MKTSLRRWQYEAAKRGNASLLIWLGKQYLGQHDRRLRGLGAEQLGIGEHSPENFQGRQRTSSGRRGSEQIV